MLSPPSVRTWLARRATSVSGVASARARSGRAASDAAEHGAVGEAGTARIIEVENAAHHLPSSEETGDRVSVRVDDAGGGVDLDTTEGEGEAAGDGIGLERWFLDGDGPVGFSDRKPLRATAVLDVGVERHIPLHRRVEPLDGLKGLTGVDAVELFDELLERVGGRLGNALDAVFIAQEMQHLLVEYLPAELSRLHQDHAPVLGIGVVAEVGTLVDETLAVGVDHDREGIVVLLEIVAHR